jgi:ABC-type multidrug transport system fused ATPase/permease subunit
MNWLIRLLIANWRIAIVLIVLLCVWLSGMWVGEGRIQRAWDAERHQAELVLARQEQKLADIKRSQEQITHEISNEFNQRSAQLAADWHPRGSVRVRSNLTDNYQHLPADPATPSGVDQAASDPVPAASGDAGWVTCGKLAVDAAQTTLMLIEMQRWYFKLREMSLGISNLSFD